MLAFPGPEKKARTSIEQRSIAGFEQFGQHRKRTVELLSRLRPVFYVELLTGIPLPVSPSLLKCCRSNCIPSANSEYPRPQITPSILEWSLVLACVPPPSRPSCTRSALVSSSQRCLEQAEMSRPQLPIVIKGWQIHSCNQR